jgi:shikimate dehydrogenase
VGSSARGFFFKPGGVKPVWAEFETQANQSDGSRMMKALPIVDARTRLFAVFGDPVSHSLSPVMHNRAFREVGYNGVYVAIQVRDIEAAVGAIRSLSIRGVSITVPHKTAVLPFLDHIDPMARKIGAVNTIVNQKGELWGYNTDSEAAISALKVMDSLSGRKVAIIGAGGAARAVGFGLVREKMPVMIVNRTASRGRELADSLGADFQHPEEFQPADGDILVNTTPVGMWPRIDASPFPHERLEPGMMVMDLIYNPLRSRLLQEAAARGCRVLNGIPMFVHQGELQFKLWTGQEPPRAAMMQAVTQALAPAGENGAPEPSGRKAE